MKYHRYRCFGPSWPFRYAYGVAYTQTEPCEEEEETKPWQEHRQHRHRSRRSGSFGVRRPLRYLSYQLDLDESQRRKIAVALDSVKVEREQNALDEKKTIGDLADLVSNPEVSTDSLTQALPPRVRGTEQLQRCIAAALKDIVGVLDPDQRDEFVYLLRSGAFRI
jgi:hypothetical protein